MAAAFVSINQLSLYSTNIPGEARLIGATAKSVFNSEFDEAVVLHQQAIGYAGVCGRNAKSRRPVLRSFLKVAIEMAEWTDIGRLLHREGAQE